MSLQRYLDGREVLALGTAPTQAAEYQGRMDERALARAFDLLCTRYPVICGRIRHNNLRYELYVSSEYRPELTVLDGDEHTVQQEAKQPWDPARAVAQLILIRKDARGFVALRMDHAVVNGSSWRAIFYDLWGLYTDIVNGCDVSVARGDSLPRPPSDFFKRFRTDIEYSPSSETTPILRSSEPYGIHPVRIRLSSDDTTRLIDAARTYRTSVHGLVSGAVLVAQRDYGAPTTEPTPMICRSPVDLRNLVTPPVGATECTNFHSMHIAKVSVPAGGNPVTIGREIKRQLEDAIARRDLPQTPVSQQAETCIENRLKSAHVTNGGRLAKLPQPASLTITDWLRFLDTTPINFPAYAVVTYEGRLSITSWYPRNFFTIREAEQLSKHIASQLHHIGTAQFAL